MPSRFNLGRAKLPNITKISLSWQPLVWFDKQCHAKMKCHSCCLDKWACHRKPNKRRHDELYLEVVRPLSRKNDTPHTISLRAPPPEASLDLPMFLASNGARSRSNKGACWQAVSAHAFLTLYKAAFAGEYRARKEYLAGSEVFATKWGSSHVVIIVELNPCYHVLEGCNHIFSSYVTAQ